MDRKKPASSALHAEHARIDSRQALPGLARKGVGLLYGSIDFAFISAAVNVRRISPPVFTRDFSQAIDRLSIDSLWVSASKVPSEQGGA
ncbi:MULTISPECIES: hypothetical protein [Pseudomonas]|uniref:hypothetical protein n=1 Tax=Pseudomonas TaxID=286 RepID=UPI000B35872B|nr:MULTISPECIES: hypothetical protein [Pseudomonas]PMY65260.1 hypothetical protein C1Y31_15575 [Pseudomonas sp. FW305-25]PMY74474.1 hypothetical protein C1Y32_04290 [Pseudomonas sp. FW126-L8]PNA81869.1 hypothetical protein C1Y33_06305 [Pseudomonas sp. FW305-76]